MFSPLTTFVLYNLISVPNDVFPLHKLPAMTDTSWHSAHPWESMPHDVSNVELPAKARCHVVRRF